jgi:hypothetical protein
MRKKWELAQTANRIHQPWIYIDPEDGGKYTVYGAFLTPGRSAMDSLKEVLRMKKPIIFIQGRTMDTWSTVVESIDDLPTLFRQPLKDKYPTLPYAVHAPAVKGWRNSMPETVICLEGLSLSIFAENKGKCAVTELRIDEMDGIETGLDLLTAWMRFFSKGERIMVRYNSVGERLYKPFVEAFRKTAEGVSTANAQAAEGTSNAMAVELLGSLLHRDYKYHSYSDSTLAGRSPKSAFYQPNGAIARRFFSPRTISSYLLARSSNLLYAFSEAKPIRDRKEAAYSMVIRIVRLDGRLSLSALPTDKGYEWVSFVSSGRELFRVPLLAASKDEFARFGETLK